MYKFIFHRYNLKIFDLYLWINPVFDSKIFISFFFFFALMPYVSPVPLGSDVQIITGAISYFIIGFSLLKNRFIVSPRELLIILLALFFIFYFNSNESTYQFRKAIGPLYAFGVYYVTKKYKDYLSLKVIDLVITVYFIGALLQLIAPNIFELTFEYFIRESKYTTGTSRGVTSLTPEPSFLGIVCIYILIINDWIYKRLNYPKNNIFYIRRGILILMILLTKSGAGYILLLFLYASKTKHYFKKYWVLIITFSLVSLFFILNTEKISGNKGLSDLVKILKSTSFKDILSISSFSNRLNPLIVGIAGAIDKPFGRGSGSFTSQAKDVYLDKGIDQIYPIYRRDRLLYEISADSVSTFGKYIFEYGIFFLVYLFLIFLGLNFNECGLFTFFLLLSGLLFSLPIVYPPLWLIFGIYDRRIRII